MPITIPGTSEPVVCTGKPQPDAPPFLTPPYRGYAEIATFFDHDQPDYAIDGRLVTTTGLTATGTPLAGVFPAYWSPRLRQYIYYDGHNGYDYDISYQPVYAAAAGVVSYAAWESSDPYYGYGQMIVIKHQSGYMTLYGHLSKLDVRAGERVKAGQLIGISGTTGHSSGPHLHFTVYHNCHAVDPYGWNGPGKDPLLSFNGETSTYLWKQASAPRILDPLPDWPTFAGATKAPALPQLPNGTGGAPVVSHLLLLRPPVIAQASPDVAVADFNQALTDEQRQLRQILAFLQRQGLVKSYAVVPGEGAIRVTGDIPASQLTALPGVASILGNRPKDQLEATTGLREALARSVAQPQLASIFPSTYLDAIASSQLQIAVQENGPAVLGFAQPSTLVTVTVLRKHRIVARSRVASDGSRGAFAVTLMSLNGHPFTILPRDVVKVSAGGSFTTVDVTDLTVSAKTSTGTVSGTAPYGAKVDVSAIEDMTSQTVQATAAVGASTPGHFSASIGDGIGPGDTVVASVVDAAGNRMFTLARASGFRLTLGSANIQGWSTPDTHWRADVFAQHRWIESGATTSGPQGYLSLSLSAPSGASRILEPGFHLRLRSGRVTKWIGLAPLYGRLSPHKSQFLGSAPRHAHLFLRLWNDSSGVWIPRSTMSGKRGGYIVGLHAPIKPGSSVDVTYKTVSGDLIRATKASRGVVMHEDQGLITGHATAGRALLVRAYGPHGTLLATGITGTSTSSGAFSVVLYKINQKPQRLIPGDRLTLSDGLVTTSYAVPAVYALPAPDGSSVTGWTREPGNVSVSLANHGQVFKEKVSKILDGGRFNVNLGKSPISADEDLQVTVGSPFTGAAELDFPVVPPPSLDQLGRSLGGQILYLKPWAENATSANFSTSG